VKKNFHESLRIFIFPGGTAIAFSKSSVIDPILEETRVDEAPKQNGGFHSPRP
jgi:hypothetical protein